MNRLASVDNCERRNVGTVLFGRLRFAAVCDSRPNSVDNSGPNSVRTGGSKFDFKKLQKHTEKLLELVHGDPVGDRQSY